MVIISGVPIFRIFTVPLSCPLFHSNLHSGTLYGTFNIYTRAQPTAIYKLCCFMAIQEDFWSKILIPLTSLLDQQGEIKMFWECSRGPSKLSHKLSLHGVEVAVYLRCLFIQFNVKGKY